MIPTRPFEKLLLAITLLGLLTVLCLDWLGSRIAAVHPGTGANCIGLVAAVLLLHAVREGARLQLVPTYAALGLMSVAFFLNAIGASTNDATAWSKGIAALGIVSLAISLLAQWLLPMFRFDPLSGGYATGTSIVHLVDSSRKEESGGPRELMVQLWYPAVASRKPFEGYRRSQETTRISSYQAVLATRSRRDAPLAETTQRLPVLLFHPAWNGRRTQNTFLVEELASHGFVVAAIDHTYNSEPVAFPDGRIVRAQHVRAMEDVSTSTADEIQKIGNDEVRRQVLDGSFVLDQLTAWNAEEGSRWYQRLDPHCAGALGHSLGGAVAIESWATDVRIQAAMNMDGWTFGYQAATGQRANMLHRTAIPKPLLFFYEGNYTPFPTAEQLAASTKCETEREVDAWDAAHVRALLHRYGGYCLKLHGANHMNFTDRTVTSPLQRLAGGGSIDPRQAHHILREYAIAFFSQALRGQTSNLLQERPSRFCEVAGLTESQIESPA